MRATPFTAAGDEIRWSDIPAPQASQADGASAHPVRVYIHGLDGTGVAGFGNVAPHRFSPGGASSSLLASGTVDVMPLVVIGLAVLAAGAAILGATLGRSATHDHRR